MGENRGTRTEDVYAGSPGWVSALFFDMCNLECFPMEVSRPGWKSHVHNLLHSISELAYFSSLFLDPLSQPRTLFSSLANHGWEALTDGWALQWEADQCFPPLDRCHRALLVSGLG